MNTTFDIYEKYKKQIDELTNINPELGNFYKGEFLKKEAKRRGFEVGVRFKCMYKIGKLRNGVFLFNCPVFGLCLIDNSKNSGNYIFWDGNWAKIIDDKSELKEEIKSLEDKLKDLRSKL